MEGDVGLLIAWIRRQHGLTQAQLAQRAGTTQSVISAYEHGRRDPSVSTLRRLVEAGGERLFVGVQPPEPTRMTPMGDAAHADRLLDLLALADAIPRRVRRRRLEFPRIESR